MLVKIFSANETDILQDDINNYLELLQHKMRIIDIKYSINYGLDNVIYSAMIIIN